MHEVSWLNARASVHFPCDRSRCMPGFGQACWGTGTRPIRRQWRQPLGWISSAMRLQSRRTLQGMTVSSRSTWRSARLPNGPTGFRVPDGQNHGYHSSYSGNGHPCQECTLS